MDAAIYGLLGAVIGALASVGGMYVQQKQQNRRDRLKIAVDLAIQEYNRDLELAKAKTGGAFVAPLDSYVICHASLLDALAEGVVTPEKIRELTSERDRILAAFPGAPDENGAAQKAVQPA